MMLHFNGREDGHLQKKAFYIFIMTPEHLTKKSQLFERKILRKTYGLTFKDDKSREIFYKEL